MWNNKIKIGRKKKKDFFGLIIYTIYKIINEWLTHQKFIFQKLKSNF